MSRVEKRDEDVAVVHNDVTKARAKARVRDALWDEDADQEREDWTERRATLRAESWRQRGDWQHYVVDDENGAAWLRSDVIEKVER